MRTLPSPVRLHMFHAARRLGMGSSTMQRLCARGVFTVIRPDGKGRGKRAYVFTDEVDAYLTGGEDAVRTVLVRTRRLGARYAG